ncbi:MAG: ATP-binding protein [Bacteroidia bacterium]
MSKSDNNPKDKLLMPQVHEHSPIGSPVSVDEIPVMLIIIDSDHQKISYINQLVLQVLGGSETDYHGKPLSFLIAEEYQADVSRHLTTLPIHNKTVISEVIINDLSGRRHDVVMHSRYAEGKTYIVLHNVTQYKKYERLNKILESRVEKRTNTLKEQLDYITQQNRQLNDFKSALLSVMEDLKNEQHHVSEVKRLVQELQRSNEELEQYASLASHDLKAPLRMVVSHLQVLSMKLGDRLKDEEKMFLNFAVEGARKMDYMLSGILEYSRISSEKRPFEQVEIQKVIEEAIGNLHAVIEESDASIEFTEMPCLMGDYYQLVQLFQNLINNAIRYRSIFPPQVSIFFQHTPTHYLFMVRDNGIGIEEKNIHKIFRMFEKLDVTHTKAGNGLGLAICKGIIQRHGGKIWVESRPGTGTTFFFTIGKDIHNQPMPVPPKLTDLRKAGGSNSQS